MKKITALFTIGNLVLMGLISGCQSTQSQSATTKETLQTQYSMVADKTFANENIYLDQYELKLRNTLKNPNVVVKRLSPNKLQLVMENRYGFNIATSHLASSAYPLLTDFAELLHEYDQSKIHIKSYTDNNGSEKINQMLSERRANAVRNYLVSHNIADDRLSITGFGENKPKCDNNTSAGRLCNRRIEITIVHH